MKEMETPPRRRIGSSGIRAVMMAAGLATLISHQAMANRPSSMSAVNVVRLSGETVIGPAFGASILIRNSSGAHGTVSVGDLDPYTVHSVWALAFNNPEACVRDPVPICLPTQDGSDGGLAVQLSIFWVGGGIADGTGVLNLEFDLVAKRPAGFVIPAFRPDGLTNPMGAEIHLVVVPHAGAAAMLDGADGPLPGSVAWEMTHPGPATRGAVHLPPE